MKNIVIATRGSKLALWQANHIKDCIERQHAGKVSVDLDRGEVKIQNRTVELLPKEYSLLVAFLKRPGRILTYTFLADEVWGLDQVATRETIKATIHRLRAKLGSAGELICAVTGQGYKWSDE